MFKPVDLKSVGVVLAGSFARSSVRVSTVNHGVVKVSTRSGWDEKAEGAELGLVSGHEVSLGLGGTPREAWAHSEWSTGCRRHAVGGTSSGCIAQVTQTFDHDLERAVPGSRRRAEVPSRIW